MKRKKPNQTKQPLRLIWPQDKFSMFSNKKGSNLSLISKTKSTTVRWNDNIGIKGDNRLLLQKYEPLCSKELCVSPRKVKEVREWIDDSFVCSSKMLILVGNPGIGKSTMCHMLTSEMGMSLLQWNHSYGNQSQILSFEYFLKAACSGISELNIEFDSRSKGGRCASSRNLILIEELPFLHNDETKERLRNILSNHVLHTKTPTILIYSDVSEGKPTSGALEKLIDSSVLYSPNKYVRILKIPSVTEKVMKKCLSSVAQKEGLRLNPEIIEHVSMNSRGDIRNSLMNLELYILSYKKYQKNAYSQNLKSNAFEKDVKLCSFHALGKLLYAKRKDIKEEESPSFNALGKLLNTDLKINDVRPHLSFNPEQVITQSEMDLNNAHSFLAYNCPVFFTDITELSECFDYFSDASLFKNRLFDHQRDHGDTIYPMEYLCSLSSRSVAHFNKHPTPNKFRSFKAPKIFDVIRKRKGNELKINQLCRRLYMNIWSKDKFYEPYHREPFLDMNIGSSQSMTIDFLPYMQTIIPHEICFAVENLYSFSQEDNDEASNGVESLLHLELQEQRKILQNDDIIDDSD